MNCTKTYSEKSEPCVAFKYLRVGLISELKRKSLPEIAKVVGLENEQGLLHFLTESPWRAEELEKRRLEIILNLLEGREIIVIIDETGDKKKGKKTDYVKRQYIGKLGKIESGIVSVNAYGYCDGMTFPLQYWEVTTDKEHYSPDNSWLIMTRIPQLKYPEVGAIYGVRTWVE